MLSFGRKIPFWTVFNEANKNADSNNIALKLTEIDQCR